MAGISELVAVTGKVGVEDIEFGLGTNDDVFNVPAAGYPEGVTRHRLPSLSAAASSVFKGVYYVSNSASITSHGASSGADYEAYNIQRVIDEIGEGFGAMKVHSGSYNLGGLTITVPENIEFLCDMGFAPYNGRLVVMGRQMPFVVPTVDSLSSLPGVYDNQACNTLGLRLPGDKAGGAFYWDGTSTTSVIPGRVIAVTGVPTGRWFRRDDQEDCIFTLPMGDYADGVTDDSQAITEALTYANGLKGNSVRNMTVKMRSGGYYLFESGITIPNSITLDANGSIIEYTGSGTAVTAGDRSDTLNYFTNFINFFIKLKNHAATGLKTLCTTKSHYKGTIEGHTVGITNTRTCVGVEINGGTASSFENVYEVLCNHLHKNFFITCDKTAAGHQPTMLTFLNCSANGDYYMTNQADSNSWGWYFDDYSYGGMGDGTVFVGSNVEGCGGGVYFGDGSRGIDCNLRWEISSWTDHPTYGTSNTRRVVFHPGSSDIHISGAGLQIASMGVVNGGIEGFAAGRHFIKSDANGHSRECGNDTNITSGHPTKAWGYTDFFLKKNTNISFVTKDNDTGTGSIFMQPGSGSGAHGAYWHLFAQAHATNPGSFLCGIGAGSGGRFAVTNGLGGSEYITIDTTSTRPGLDNAFSCGTSGKKWTAVYATNGTIQTSDERDKERILPINDIVLDAWSEVDFCQYQWIKRDGKIHFGVIAQRIVEAFWRHGLEATDYGIVYYDTGADVYSVQYDQCLVLEMALNRKLLKAD